jgi:hypothetical protein
MTLLTVLRSSIRQFFAAALLLVAFQIPAARSDNAPLPTPVRTWTSPGHTKYYVDSVGGNDANDGKSADHAWQNLEKVNTGTFAPGDWILLKSGSHWNGYLAPGGSGEQKHPVKVTSYGDGPKPQINAQGKTLATLNIQNQEYWDIENLDIANTSTGNIPWLRCVEINLLDFGTAHDITLSHCDIHDLTGPEDKEHGGSAIFTDNRGDKVQSRFDGLLIEDNHLWHNDRNGITMDSGYTNRAKWYPNLNVVIRGNLVEHTGGDCICAIGCDGALIEHNIVRGGRERATDWATGIWVWSCDNSIIQYNESGFVMGQMDAQGFDADFNTQNTIIQYNYSHDNGGGFVMMCTPGGAKPPDLIGNDNTIVRYNISQNDGFRTFTLSGFDRNSQIYNNTIYVGKSDTTILFFAWNWGGIWPDNTMFANNIFYSDGNPTTAMGGSTKAVFTNNSFYGTFGFTPTDPHIVSANPVLKSPGSAANGVETLDGYKLNRNSPCADAGIVIPNNGGVDFFGKRVPSDKAPTIGACQQ